MQLSILGLGEIERRIYEAILHRPGVTIGELAELLTVSEAVLEPALATLESQGFLSWTADAPPTLAAVSPDLAIAALIPRKIQELEELRREATELTVTLSMRSTTRTALPFEIVTGQDALVHRSSQVEVSAVREVRLIDAPGYILPTSAPNQIEVESLGRGIRYRVLYHPSSFSTPGKLDAARACVAAGEEARLYTGPPLKLAISDEKLAILYDPQTGPDQSAVILRPSFVLDAISFLFEQVWESAVPVLDVPVGSTGRGREQTIDRDVLNLLAAGLSDEQIGQSLGTGLRTVGRRIAAILSFLGAETRFQAGLKAAERGLIGAPESRSESEIPLDK